MDKDIATRFYTSRAWRQCRKDFLSSKGGLCEDCLARGIITPADEVHHIEKLTPTNIDNPEVSLNFENLKCLCKNCHMTTHSHRKNKRWKVGENGEIISVQISPLSCD